MKFSDLIAQTIRSTRSRPLESLLIVFVIALSVGVEASMLALILNGAEQGRALSQSPQARELVMVNSNNDFQSFYTATGINPVIKIAAGKPPDTFDQTELQAALKACPALQYGYLADADSLSEPVGQNATRSKDVQMWAITASYIEAAKLELLAGAWPSGKDFRDRLPMIAVTELFARKRFEQPVSSKPVLSKAASESSKTSSSSDKPFALRDVIGKTIATANHVTYTIVAVFATPESVMPNAGFNDGFQFVNKNQRAGAYGILPWGREDNVLHNLTNLKFLAFPDQLEAAQEQLQAYSTKRFGPGISIIASRDQIMNSLNASASAALVTALFASAALVIAALNITNLMLARVLGRTRAIGISNALGASSRTILTLFLTESLLLGLFGGLLGMVLARGMTAGLQATLNAFSPLHNLDLSLQPLHFALSLLVAFGVSLLFGVYPALMASRIRPAEALRG
jgi:ABC-type antimicrobial peptide transport system permease subunit